MLTLVISFPPHFLLWIKLGVFVLFMMLPASPVYSTQYHQPFIIFLHYLYALFLYNTVKAINSLNKFLSFTQCFINYPQGSLSQQRISQLDKSESDKVCSLTNTDSTVDVYMLSDKELKHKKLPLELL